MTFLYPLFLAGIAAVGLPIMLHMIRRHTHKRVTFSSLMFLRTTVLRLRNRGRLENLPLLALRCASLILLAFGFSRPFFPAVDPPVADAGADLARRIALLIDTSASMRRAGMWPHAVSEARSVLEGLSQADRVCVMSFAQSTQTLIGFEEWGALAPSQRASAVSEEISKLSPGWALTDLGHALVSAAEAIEDDEISDGQQPVGMRQVVLISDLQQGSSLEALQAYEWPRGMELVVKLIRCQGTTNAALQLVTPHQLNYAEGPSARQAETVAGSQLVQSDDLAPPGRNDLYDIRITNSPDATRELFCLHWAYDSRADKSGSSQITDVYVPAGHSIVVRVPTRSALRSATENRTDELAGGKLVLTGDDHDFDNTLHLAPYLEQQVNILYIGTDDANDPDGMLYYAQRAFAATRTFKPRIVSRPADSLSPTDGRSGSLQGFALADIATADLVIVADAIEPPVLLSQESRGGSLRRYLESGGTVLLVMKSPEAAATVAALAGIETINSEEADVDRYAMLSQIEFKHPLLAPFTEPRFGDFTQIHFWKYRRINIADCPGAEVLAWFDNPTESGLIRSRPSDWPAWFELHVGKGTLLVLASGWHPSDSQLALSSKFVPLLYSILEYGGILTGQAQYFVGDHVPIPRSIKSESANLKIRKPDDSLTSLDASPQSFTQTDLPGTYAIHSSAGPALGAFAVNLSAKECQTATMPIEDLERYGISFKAAEEEQPQVKRGAKYSALPEKEVFCAKMESEQKVWRWVFIVLLAVSLIEIWLAGWLTRPPSISQGEQK